MPLVNPVTVAVVEGGLPETVIGAKAVPPDEGVRAEEVIGEPPLAGAVQDTDAEALPAVALTPVGVPGTVGAVGVTGDDAADGADVPTAFEAVTVNVYAVPLLSPVTVAVVEGGLPETVTGAKAVPPDEGVTA